MGSVANKNRIQFLLGGGGATVPNAPPSRVFRPSALGSSGPRGFRPSGPEGPLYLRSSVFQYLSQETHKYKYFIFSSSYLM